MHTKVTSKEHYETYHNLVEALGIKVKSGFMDLKTSEWKKKFEEDEYLNNVKLREWDIVGLRLVGVRNPLKEGWTFSMSEVVCIYKHAVIYQIIKAKPVFE